MSSLNFQHPAAVPCFSLCPPFFAGWYNIKNQLLHECCFVTAASVPWLCWSGHAPFVCSTGRQRGLHYPSL